MSEDLKESMERIPRSNRGLALSYLVYGALVGGFFFLVAAGNGQAARSLTEANTVVAAAILSPSLMFVTGLALAFRWRWARRLAIALPAILAILCLERFVGTPLNQLGDGSSLSEFIGYFCFIQIRNLPGAIILGLVAFAQDRPISRIPISD